jgi:hypothetical protein
VGQQRQQVGRGEHLELAAQAASLPCAAGQISPLSRDDA